MGRDKAAMVYTGQTQMKRTLDLVEGSCSMGFVALREDQAVPSEANRDRVRVIRDQFGDIGPLGGLLSAMKSVQGKSWLVVAVDLPFLDSSTLEYLVANRDLQKPFTAFRNPRDGLPEPLCTIFEVHSEVILDKFWKEKGILSPRRILIESDVHLLDLPQCHVLENVNTPQDYRKILEKMERYSYRC
tara:strand:- start:14146 stop:14706 length:561 start_codon:yes stop_codon:yes gene_type:complete